MKRLLMPVMLFNLSIGVADENNNSIPVAPLSEIELFDVEAYEKELQEREAKELEIIRACPSKGIQMCEERFEGMYTSGFRYCLLECGLEPELYEEEKTK